MSLEEPGITAHYLEDMNKGLKMKLKKIASVIVTSLLCAITAISCSSSPEDSGEKTDTVNQSLTVPAFPAFFQFVELSNNSKCLSSGNYAGSQLLFSSGNCSNDPSEYFQSTSAGFHDYLGNCILDTASNSTTSLGACGSNSVHWQYSVPVTYDFFDSATNTCLQCPLLPGSQSLIGNVCGNEPCNNNGYENFSLNINQPSIPAYQMRAWYPAINTNLCLAPIYGGNSTVGTGVGVKTCDNQFDQMWVHNSDNSIIWSTSGFAGTALCLDVPDQNYNGTPVILEACNGSSTQQWVHGAPNEWYNVGTGRCLDEGGGTSPTSGAIWVWDCWGGLWQQWGGPN